VRPLEGRYILRDLPAFPLVDFNAVTLAEAGVPVGEVTAVAQRFVLGEAGIAEGTLAAGGSPREARSSSTRGWGRPRLRLTRPSLRPPSLSASGP
jgi:hypothetical protein